MPQLNKKADLTGQAGQAVFGKKKDEEEILTKVMVGKDSKCMACGSRVRAEVENLFDTRFGINKAWNICRCTDCGMEQTLPLPSPGELKELYEEYYNFGGEKATRYTRLRERFLGSPLYRIWLALDGHISFHSYKGSGPLLDIGCNEGRGLRIYQRNGYEAEGLELNEAVQEFREQSEVGSRQR